MPCRCRLERTAPDVYECREHGRRHECGAACDARVMADGGLLVCTVTGRQLGLVHVDTRQTLGETAGQQAAAKRRKTLDGQWVPRLQARRRVRLPDLTLAPVRVAGSAGFSRSRRTTQPEARLAEVLGVLRQLFCSDARLALERENRGRRLRAMADEGRRYLAAEQAAGRAGSVPGLAAAMRAVAHPEAYRFVGVPGPALDAVLGVLAWYVQGAYRRVARIRDQMQQYFARPADELVHGITRGQSSRSTVRMTVPTFVVQLIRMMARGGMRSLHGEKRVLVPGWPLCAVACPSPRQIGRLTGKLTGFRLGPLLRQADALPDDVVDDPALTMARCVPEHECLVAGPPPPLVRPEALLRMPGELGPFARFAAPPAAPLVLPVAAGAVLGLGEPASPHPTWDEAAQTSLNG